MSDNGRILVVSTTEQLPTGLDNAIEQLSLEPAVCSPKQALDRLGKLGRFDGAVVAFEKLSVLECEELKKFMGQLHKLSLNALVLAGQAALDLEGHLFEEAVLANQDESVEMLKGRLATLLDLRPALCRLRTELLHLRNINGPLNSHFTQVDEEMRLAARLQRDFLPRRLPNVAGIEFATIFRPASWVSGDIYDIMQLDETHVGFYVADVVGHGMPAALMTMFLKRALVTKEIKGHNYTIIDPGESLARLNADMVAQNLSNFQFATCCYGILDTKSLQLQLASAGHPPPMRIDSKSREFELPAKGSLMGIFPDQQYKTEMVQLEWGDKVLLFSDGVELAFINEGPDKPLQFRKEFGDLAHCSINQMCDRLLEIIDSEEGSLHPRDDVTIVGLELKGPATP